MGRRSLQWLPPSQTRRLRPRAAFTLVELLIVVALLGTLVAAAFPAYEQARSAALIGTLVGELVSYAKACALINSSGVGDPPTPAAVTPERGGVVIKHGCSGENQGATLEATWGTARARGIPCYDTASTLTSSKATIIVSSESAMSCNFAD